MNDKIDNKSGVEVIVETKNVKNTGFSGFDTYRRTCKKFNTENIKVIRKGKELCVQDWIESGREGTEIKEVLKKYSGNYALAEKEIARQRVAIGDALGEINDLRDYLEQTNKARELWDGLHGDIKSVFHNNISEFVKNGMDWAKGVKSEFDKQNSKSTQKVQNMENGKTGEA